MKFSTAPDRKRIFDALSKLKSKLEQSSDGNAVIEFDIDAGRYILFSDQHKGARNGADDFAAAEPNYLEALAYYDRQAFHLISLGDAEELWENTLSQVQEHNKASFAAERKFIVRSAFTKIFGNHDLDWQINPLARIELKSMYGKSVAVKEGIILRTRVNGKIISIFCTHGHQGDSQSDGNFFSKFIVSNIWAPLQAYLRINPNTPAHNTTFKTAHNTIMYEWSSLQHDLILITGHTHQPVFESLTHLERIKWQQNQGDQVSPNIKPGYFNTGCCCFDDGDITGIEIVDGSMHLVKWESVDGIPSRQVLETSSLVILATLLT